MDIISPMLDVMFKRMFSLPESNFMLCDLLETYIDFESKIREVRLTDKEIRRSIDDKDSIFDLRVETDTAEVDVEVQTRKYDFFADRITYYLSKMFSDQLKEGEEYTKLHKCVSLCITDFALFDDDPFCRKMFIRDDYGNILTDKMEFDFVEISKIKKLKPTKNMSKKLQWAKLLAVKNEEELNVVQEMFNNPAIDQAVVTVKKLSADKQMRLEAEAREKALRDYNSGMAEAEAKGIAKGRAEERAATIEKMRAQGYTEEQIRKFYGE